METSKHSTKNAAMAEALRKGYTQTDAGFSGDYGYGSRIYLSDPTSDKNEYGIHLKTCTVSKVTKNEWWVAYFEAKPAVVKNVEYRRSDKGRGWLVYGVDESGYAVVPAKFAENGVVMSETVWAMVAKYGLEKTAARRVEA